MPTIIETMQRVFPLSDLMRTQIIRKIIDRGMATQLSIPSRGMKATRVTSSAMMPKSVPIVSLGFVGITNVCRTGLTRRGQSMRVL